jgi:hypothetical protein
VSSTSMKVANITAMATIQGFTLRGDSIFHFIYTVAFTDIPGRSR